MKKIIITIVGLGHIGGSLASSLKKTYGDKISLIGIDQKPSTIKIAQQSNFFLEVSTLKKSNNIRDSRIVFVATGEDQTPKGPKKRITAFLVDRGTLGFTIRDGYKSVSHKGYNNMILEFDNCRLSNEQVLGEVDGGFAVMNTWLYATRITVATMSVGRARRCFEYALNYSADRKQFGESIGKFQGISFQLADMITEIDAADLLTLSSAWKLDQGLNANREIASAKLYASEMLARVTDMTLQIHGGMGLMNDYPIERFWRDARVERIWDGTSEIQKHIISRELLRPLGS